MATNEERDQAAIDEAAAGTAPIRAYSEISRDVFQTCTICAGHVKMEVGGDLVSAKEPAVPDCVVAQIYKAVRPKAPGSAFYNRLATREWLEAHMAVGGALPQAPRDDTAFSQVTAPSAPAPVQGLSKGPIPAVKP